MSSTIVESIINVIAFMLIVFGIPSCFFGYRIYKFLIGALGFIIGFSLTFLIMSPRIVSKGDLDATVIIALICGAIGYCLMIWLHYVSLFVIGSVFGFFVGHLLAAGIGGDSGRGLPILLAMIGGVAAIIISKFLIVVATSFGGSLSILSGLLHFAGTSAPIVFGKTKISQSMMENYGPFIISWFILGAVGFAIQYLPLSRQTSKAEEHNDIKPNEVAPSIPEVSPMKSDILCKGCGADLLEVQVREKLGNLKYSEWSREGYCSFTCFKKSNEGNKFIDKGLA